MDNLGELVPNLDLIQDLYRAEGFKVLHKFLFNLKEESLADLLQSKHEDAVERSILISRINLLGTLLELPQVVALVKKGLDKQSDLMSKFKFQQED